MMKLGLICLLSCVSVVNVTVSLAAESELICSHQPIVALVGDDVILPCHLEPPISASSETVEWTKPGLDPKYVHLQQAGKLNFELQNPSYYFRTRLFVDEMTRGNVSMKIFKVEISDAGKYQCFLPSIQKTASIQLTVGESDVIGSDEPIKVAEGHDVILPCSLKPPIDVTSLTVDWKHSGTTVHSYRYRMDYLVDQDERFKDRTSLFYDEMAKGNISLKLTNITEEDEGDYTCSVQQNSEDKRGKITLSVEPVDGSNKGNQTSDKDTEEPTGNGTGGKIAIVVVVVGAIAGVCVVIWWKRKRNAGISTGGKIGIAVGAIAGVCVVIRRRIRKIIAPCAGRDGTGNYEQTATAIS